MAIKREMEHNSLHPTTEWETTREGNPFTHAEIDAINYVIAQALERQGLKQATVEVRVKD